MTAGAVRLGRASTAFGVAAGITVLFNTALAWAKDAYRPLTNLMNAMAGQNWTTQGLADVILFAGLGLIFWNTHAFEQMPPNRLISFLAVAVVIAGVGLFVWYAVF
jgi:hypothetical protein